MMISCLHLYAHITVSGWLAFFNLAQRENNKLRKCHSPVELSTSTGRVYNTWRRTLQVTRHNGEQGEVSVRDWQRWHLHWHLREMSWWQNSSNETPVSRSCKLSRCTTRRNPENFRRGKWNVGFHIWGQWLTCTWSVQILRQMHFHVMSVAYVLCHTCDQVDWMSKLN